LFTARRTTQAVVFLAATYLVLLSSSVLAKDSKPKEIASPSPGEREQNFVRQMSGNYTVEMTAKGPDGSALTANGVMNVEPLPNVPAGARSSMSMTMANGEKYDEYDLVGFQGGDRTMHLLSVTCEPVAHDHIITIKDNNDFTLRWQGKENGKPSQEDVTGHWTSSNELRMEQVNTTDGKQVATATIICRRTDQAMNGR
jgi:hypothetical protein